jgi:hypothetical protein
MVESPGVRATAAAAYRAMGPSPRSYAPTVRAPLHPSRGYSPAEAARELLPPNSLVESRHAVSAALSQLRQLETKCVAKYSQPVCVAAGSN